VTDASFASSSVTRIDLGTNVPVAEATIDIPNSPGNFIAIAPDGRKAYMTDPWDGKVFPIDLTTSPATVGAAIVVGGNPEGWRFHRTGPRRMWP
jgi:DNA-binding beta-propeller fold protein YncE